MSRRSVIGSAIRTGVQAGAAVVTGVDADDVVTQLHQPGSQERPDVAVASGDENPHERFDRR